MPYLAIPGTTQRNPSGPYPYRYAYTYMGLGRSRGGYHHPVGVAYQRPHLMTTGMRGRLGDVLSDIQGIVSGGTTGATVGGPVGAVVGAAPGIISTMVSLFGPNPNSAANLERQQHMYSLYYQAMTLPGSASSIAAVRQLYCVATQDLQNGCNNPQATRTDAQTALARLASQGWVNVNSYTPQYVGAAAVSQPTGVLTPASMLPGGSGSLSFSPMTLALLGLVAFAVLR